MLRGEDTDAGSMVKLMSQSSSTGSMVDCFTSANSSIDLEIVSSLGMNAATGSGSGVDTVAGSVSLDGGAGSSSAYQHFSSDSALHM